MYIYIYMYINMYQHKSVSPMYLGSMSQRSWDSFMVVAKPSVLEICQALTDFLAKEAEMQGLTCSWDQEALQEPLEETSGNVGVAMS